eukprot:Seg1367.5 transcript_id=Seg1367.5/GoldUCD/mRNA.D3Y31 product="5-hydroxytryptamine receptor 1F" protein_id=Seg1367.5/GoldUCD/D3Y31
MTLTNIAYQPVSNKWSSTQEAISITVAISTNISAVCLNLMIITTIITTKHLRKQPDSVLIANLALSDLLVACCIMPFTSDILLRNELNFSKVVSDFVGFSNFLFCIASILNLMTLSVDQLLILRWPFKYQLHRTRLLATYIAITVWIYSALCTLPPLLGVSAYTCFIPNTGPCTNEQWAGTNDAVIFTVLVVVFSWGLGVVVLIVAYALIYQVVRRQRQAIKQTMVHSKDCMLLTAVEQKASGIAKPTFLDPKVMYRSECISSVASNDAFARNRIESRKVQNSSLSCCLRQSEQNDSDQEISAPVQRTIKPLKHRSKKGLRCSCIPNTKTATSLLIIVIVYFISWTPFCIVLLTEIALKKKQSNDLSLIFLWVGHLSSVFNPLIFFYRFRRFRIAAKALYRKMFRNTVAVQPM